MTHFAGILAATLGLTLGSGEAAPDAGRIVGTVDVGFDSFQERYSIVDEDTLDSITEFRSRIALGYANGSPFGDYLRLAATTLVGDDNAEYAGQMDLIRRFGARSSRFAVLADVARRDFFDDSSYEFANDHTRYNLNSYVRWNLAEAFALRLSDRIEHVDFEDRTEFDYDHTRNSIALQGEGVWNLGNYVGAGIRFTTMQIPDSTEIQYESWVPELEFRAAPGLYKFVSIYASAERRRYAHEPVRSSFWALLAHASLEWTLTDEVGIALVDETEGYVYDEGTDVHFDYTENRNALLVKYNHSWAARLGAGPTYAVFVSGSSPDDEYDEFGGKLTLDYASGAAVWLSAGFEGGRRSYRTFDESSDEASIYSDYTYYRVGAITTIRVWNGVSVNAFVDYQPEDHEREGDDETATLVSLSLTYSF